MCKLFHIIVLIAFIGGIIAPACGFNWGGKFSVIEICTAQGLEARIVNNNLEPLNSPLTPHQKAADKCQFCFASAHNQAYLPYSIIIEAKNYGQQKLKFQIYHITLLARLDIQSAPRGPPILV
jgi:hypothetical protein